jgi:glycosyltransferase involved in cell wall biosynthesis
VASDWNRPEKNYALVKKILSRFSSLNIHVVGEIEESSSHATHHGLITEREKLFQLLGNAKAIICPSIFDAAPGILFEAAVMGCNIIASKNCGNWMICHDELLVDPFRPANFFQKIPLALEKKFDNNLDYFLQANSYRNLLETISVF